jgi:outer membrane protein OmpA-like peptidoglycan-associated protein
VYFSLGKVYFNQGKYNEASALLAELERLGITNEKMKSQTAVLNANIEYALEHIQKPLDIHPAPLSSDINMFPLQYFPVLTADQNAILFTRRTGYSFYDDEDIFISKKDQNGAWQTPSSLSSSINSSYNEGTCTISADGRMLIFTSCEGRQSYGGCDLYISFRIGDDWTIPSNLGNAINTRSWESQPTLSADGRELYFISNRGGGIGKRDVWMSRLDHQDRWQKAWNVGRGINTAEDEVSPFIHVNGQTLFFASKGYLGFGGFDLYKTEKTKDGWSEPSNLGYPINDHDDQVSLFITTDGAKAYYSYETKGDGLQNRSVIYSFDFPESEKIVKRSNYLTGVVRDAEDKHPLKAKVELFDLEVNEIVNTFNSDQVSGQYYSILTEGGNYGLYVEADGYLFESRTFNYRDSAFNEPIVQDFYLQPIKSGSRTVLNNIFFDFDSYELLDESITELERIRFFLRDHDDLKVEISGHTDDLGSESYNLELSTQRAKTVYQYLLDHDIKSDNLSYKGYGESDPLKENIDESSRKMNRRIEFRILD